MSDDATPANPAPAAPDAAQQFNRLIHEHVQWLFKVHGPQALSALMVISLGMASALGSANGQPLPPDIQRLKDAAEAALRAMNASLAGGIVTAPAGTLVNGKRVG